MARSVLTALAAVVLLGGSVPAALGQEKRDKGGAKPQTVTVTKVDAAKGAITVKYNDAQGKPHEKTFQLTHDVRVLDETGQVIKIDVFEAGNEALVVESEGRLRELRRAPNLSRARRCSDAVRALVEMADCDEGCAGDLQKIYDMLRKLDTGKNGKIDPKAIKAEADHILQERVKEVFGRLDANKDGKISKDEARGLVKEHFEQIDANRDGFIAFDELLQAARKRHEHQPADGKRTDSRPAQKEK